MNIQDAITKFKEEQKNEVDRATEYFENVVLPLVTDTTKWYRGPGGYAECIVKLSLDSQNRMYWQGREVKQALLIDAVKAYDKLTVVAATTEGRSLYITVHIDLQD